METAQPKYTTKVSCSDCQRVWFKRTSALKEWSGKCMSCVKKGLVPWNKKWFGKRVRKTLEVTCKDCHASLSKREDCIKGWSGLCRACSNRLMSNNFRLHRTKKPQRTCLDCSVCVYPSSMRCRPCSTKLRSGENHYKWKADRTQLAMRQERNDMAYKEWRKQVWLRDNFKCKIGNPDCLGRIEAHHILPWAEHPELRYEINNGITLCHHHHPRKRVDEQRMIPELQGLLLTFKPH